MRTPVDPTQRRRLLKAAGGLLVTVPALGFLAACRSQSAGANATATNAANDGATASRWASGGTAKIGDPSRFPNPFGDALGDACKLTCMATIGPCHAASPEHSDVSDGWEGLPMRMALRVVDKDCRPVPNAIVEIWHTNRTGGYSGQIAAMCNNDQADLDKQFFRGWQRTDADGRVDFDTCYPGWYRGRAVHVHLRVMTGAYDRDDRAASAVTTQLLYTDALNHEIFTTHPLYKPYGEPDTTLDRDGVVGAETDKAPYLFDVQRMDDGVMFVSKTLIVRNAGDQDVCEAKGIMPPGGPGGPDGRPLGAPPDGFGPPPQDMPPPSSSS
ncbi:MAG: hypothetical protein QM719_12850 [Thermomonas sp.]